MFDIVKPGSINPAYAHFNLDLLPYCLPDELPLELCPDVKQYFSIIKKLTTQKDVDEIIIATDPDKEGQNIYRKIRTNLPGIKAKETRLWINEWTPEGLRDAYKNRKPNSDYKTLSLAAQCREESDWIIGMEGTAAMTAKFGGFNNLLTVGRVQTATLKIVVDRENQIKTFKPEPYSILTLSTATEETQPLILTHKTKDRLSKTQAENLQKIIKGLRQVQLKKESKKVKQHCLKLYNTIDIQVDMNKKYGYTPSETLDILQALYQTHGLTTYPRTEKNVISIDASKTAVSALKNLQSCGLFDSLIEECLKNGYSISKTVTTSENLPHEAITPVYGSINVNEIKKLNTKELNVYTAIVQRFLQAFFPDAVFDEVNVSTEINHSSVHELFEAKGRTLVEPGWMRVTGIKKDKLLPMILDGKNYDILDVQKEDKFTTPPPRYSEATLLEAMEHAGRYVEESEDTSILNKVEGLGTGATRANILEKLKKQNYITLDKKQVIPTEKAFGLFEVLPECTLSSPIQTARMEKDLELIVQGSMTREEYMRKIHTLVNDLIEKIKQAEVYTVSNAQSLGQCPICNAPLAENSKAYYCSHWKQGCKFTIWKESYNKKITPKILTDILKGRSSLLTFKLPNGKEYKARLVLDENHVLIREYENTPMKSISTTYFGTCPNCGKQMIETSKSYACSGYSCGCKTAIWKNALAGLGKKTINKGEAKKLLDGQTLRVKLVSSKGIPYEKDAYYDQSENKIKVKF